MVPVVFVAPYALDATSRFVRAVAEVPGARVGLLSTDPVERFPAEVRAPLASHWRIDDCLDPEQLARGVGALGERLGGVTRLVAILENLQEPLALVRQHLGIEGLTPDVAHNFRDKARMKTVMAAAGVPCARHQLASDAAQAVAFAQEVGVPFVVKPPAGAGARNTFRIDDRDQLSRWLAADPPRRERPALLEELLHGAEHSFDSVMVGGELVWHSVGRYHPTPLEVVEHPWIQWCVVLPRDVGQYDDVRPVAARALHALGLRTGLTHMEWFRLDDGSAAVSEVAVRPPGAQFMTLMSWAHDTDLYAAWARLVVHGTFAPPERSFAVGAAYLRAQGTGDRVTAVHGLDRVSPETRSLVVEVHLPPEGGAVSSSYEGEGYVIVRHPDTSAVEQALGELVTTVRVERS